MSHHLHNCVSYKMSLKSLLSVMNHLLHLIHVRDMYGSIFFWNRFVETASLDISIVSYELMNVTKSFNIIEHRGMNVSTKHNIT